MAKQENLIHGIAEQMDISISLVDVDLPDCPLVYVNPAFEKLTGYGAKDVIGRNCRFLQGEKTDRNDVQMVGQAVRKFQPFVATLSNVKADGTEFSNLVVIRPLHLDDGRRLLLGTQFEFNFAMKREKLARSCFRRFDAMNEFSKLMLNVEHQTKNALIMRAEAAVSRINNYCLRQLWLGHVGNKTIV